MKKTIKIDVELFTPAEFFDFVVETRHIRKAYIFYGYTKDEIADKDIVRELLSGICTSHFFQSPKQDGVVCYSHSPVDYAESKAEFCEKYDRYVTVFMVAK